MTESALPLTYDGGPPAVPLDPAEDDVMDLHGFTFYGSAAEYFRVWIVNIALSVLTLGIYSAWAKVRNKQYFYGNSVLAGSSFEYTANPVNILKGRAIVFFVLVAYQVASTVQPMAALAIALLVVPLLPWVIINAVRFNHRHSAYRNLSFHFDARYWEGFRVYILLTLAIFLSFGLAYPFVAWRRKQFLVTRSRFGNGEFSYGAEVGYFYLVYIIAGVIYAGVVIGAMVLVSGAAVFFAPEMGADVAEGVGNEGPGPLFFLALFIGYVAFFIAFIIFNTGIQAAISNYVWSSTRLDDIQFRLELSLPRIIWLQISNIAAIVLSFGLLIPWARVRMVRYRLSCFTMRVPPERLDRFVATQREYVTATGDEMGEAFDLDLGL